MWVARGVARSELTRGEMNNVETVVFAGRSVVLYGNHHATGGIDVPLCSPLSCAVVSLSPSNSSECD
jgi:hypothetical protein